MPGHQTKTRGQTGLENQVETMGQTAEITGSPLAFSSTMGCGSVLRTGCGQRGFYITTATKQHVNMKEF